MSVEVEEVTEAVEPESTVMHAVVKIKDESGKLWRETGEVISVSPTGAGFYLNRECKPGRLVSLMIPIEPHLRFYDHDKELYRVWGLVQHCHQLGAGAESYHIGVAFIGKDAPESYKGDPMQSYRIVGMSDDGMWRVNEAAREFTPRKDTRYYTAVEHYLAVVNAEKDAMKGERTTTENISKHGAAVVTSLSLSVGDRVKIISEKYDFSGLAVVCNSREVTDGKRRINLQFVGTTFPVERVTMQPTKPADQVEYV